MLSGGRSNKMRSKKIRGGKQYNTALARNCGALGFVEQAKATINYERVKKKQN
jgi:hypothetical protein